jgi:hypothetical protein
MDGKEMVAMVLVLGSGIWFVLRPIAAAIAKRIAGDVPARRTAGETSEAIANELRDEVVTLRQEVAELAERVDFTERLLAKQQDAVRLERPR